MNQQRQRRFRSAKEAKEALEKARGEGKPVPEHPFDSNCITPGTEFMQNLSEHLKFYIRKKFKEDSNWRELKVIFSGHEVPGEGEHKIMEYIRNNKPQHDWCPDQRHCLYGLDADLIMLALASHEPHFSLLREAVGPRGRPIADEFILLHVCLLREYFDLEFRNDLMSFPFDLERVVDDFILLCFFIGNDFLPNMPGIDIAEGSLNIMFEIYKDLLPDFGYLVKDGEIQIPPFQQLLQKLAVLERDRMETLYEYHDLKLDTILKEKEEHIPPATDFSAFSHPLSKKEGEGEGEEREGEHDNLEMDVKKLRLGEDDEEEQEEGSELDEEEAKQISFKWKDNYYRETFEFGYATEDRKRALSVYLHGLQWVLHYYFHGCVSWAWFYPYHYAPLASGLSSHLSFSSLLLCTLSISSHPKFLSSFSPFPSLFSSLSVYRHLTDLQEFGSFDFRFELGTPFLPFQQLMAVLPPASFSLLPGAYQALMTSETSPIVDFYPTKFEIDMAGKRNSWEGIVLVPFIDEERLLSAIQSQIDVTKLTEKEKERNLRGSSFIFGYDPNNSNSYPSSMPLLFPEIPNCHSSSTTYSLPSVSPKEILNSFRLKDGARTGITNHSLFPTLQSLPHSCSLQNIGIKVFGMASRFFLSSYFLFRVLLSALSHTHSLSFLARSLPLLYLFCRRETMLVSLENNAEIEGYGKLQDVAGLLGKHVFVDWPHHREALLTGVSCRDGKMTTLATSFFEPQETGMWEKEARVLEENLLHKMGVSIGKVEFVVHLRLLERMVQCSDGSITKRFSGIEERTPLQAVVFTMPSTYQDARFRESGPVNLKELFPLECEAIFLGRPHTGATVTVKGHDEPRKEVKVLMAPVPSEPSFGHRISVQMQERYYPLDTVSRMLDISPRVLSKLTGSLYIDPFGNTGLNIKFTAKNQQVQGYARRTTIQRTGYRNNYHHHQQHGGYNENSKETWEFSEKAVNVLGEYKARFPLFFEAIEDFSRCESISALELFPEGREVQAETQLRAIQQWLKTLDIPHLPLVPCGSLYLSPDAIVAVEEAADKWKTSYETTAVSRTPISRDVAPSLLLVNDVASGGGLGANNSSASNEILESLGAQIFSLGDRVMNLRTGGSPPFGLRGTVVEIIIGPPSSSTPPTPSLAVLFDSEFFGGLKLNSKCAGLRGMRSFSPKDLLLLPQQQVPQQQHPRQPRQAATPLLPIPTPILGQQQDKPPLISPLTSQGSHPLNSSGHYPRGGLKPQGKNRHHPAARGGGGSYAVPQVVPVTAILTQPTTATVGVAPASEVSFPQPVAIFPGYATTTQPLAYPSGCGEALNWQQQQLLQSHSRRGHRSKQHNPRQVAQGAAVSVVPSPVVDDGNGATPPIGVPLPAPQPTFHTRGVEGQQQRRGGHGRGRGGHHSRGGRGGRGGASGATQVVPSPVVSEGGATPSSLTWQQKKLLGQEE
jgi:5'-3' exoribonuclease 1